MIIVMIFMNQLIALKLGLCEDNKTTQINQVSLIKGVRSKITREF